MTDTISLNMRLKQVIAEADPSSKDHFYLLIDQCAFPNLPRRKLALSRLPQTSLLPTFDAFDGATPMLIQVDSLCEDSATQELMQWLCEQGQWANGLMMLRTPLPLMELRNRLKARTEATLPDNFHVLLRFFDCRILPQLLSTLAVEQRKHFLCCAREWHYVDREGSLQTLGGVEFSSDDEFDPPLVFDEMQQNVLIKAADADAVIDILRRHAQFEIQHTPPEQYRHVSGLVRAAKSYGVADVPHLAAFSMIGLREGTEFHLTEPWRSALSEVKAGALSFPQALDRLESGS